LAGTTGATTGATFGARAARLVTGFFLIAARRLGAGFALGVGLAARVVFLAGVRAGFFFAGFRAAVVFFLAVREAVFFVVRRLAAVDRAFFDFAAFFALVAGRFFEDVDRAFFIG
jgi:hypothetical protein